MASCHSAGQIKRCIRFVVAICTRFIKHILLSDVSFMLDVFVIFFCHIFLVCSQRERGRVRLPRMVHSFTLAKYSVANGYYTIDCNHSVMRNDDSSIKLIEKKTSTTNNDDDKCTQQKDKSNLKR